MNSIVFAEQTENGFKKSTYEAIAYATEITKTDNGFTIAVVIGKFDDAKISELAKYGADKVICLKNEKLNAFDIGVYTKLLSDVAVSENASLIVVSNTYSGKSIAPRLAAKLKSGIASGVISYPDTKNGFKVRRTVFSGKAFADIELKTAIKILAISPNSFELITNEKPVNSVTVEVNLNETDFTTKSIEISRVTGKIALTEAEIVVSAGRGMKGPENWHLIESLATELGAATACSKPVADMHWRPHNEHVGQTGITIKPNLYIAIGISGAIQHLAGVSSSKVIVVINKDPEAPFFKAADYGIVGDAFEVLPKLIDAAKALRN